MLRCTGTLPIGQDEGRSLAAIPLDLAVDGLRSGAEIVHLPKFAKAVLRISKLLVSEKKKLGLIYPNSVFPWTPYCVLEVYFFLAKKMGSRTRPKILVVTDNTETIQTYRGLTNEFGSPFVDYVYTGFFDSAGFHRIKTLGSTRGSQQAQIKREECQVFFCKPTHFDLSIGYDFALIEDVHRLMRRRNLTRLQALLGADKALLGVLGSPSPGTLSRVESMGLQTWGWTEDSLRRQMIRFGDKGVNKLPEARFPKFGVQILDPNPQLKTLLELASTSYRKTMALKRNARTNNPVVERVLFEMHFYLRRVLTMPVPLETFEKTQEELGYVPLRKRLALTKSAIDSLSERLVNSLELDGTLNALNAVLLLPLPKWDAIHSRLSQSYKRVYLVASDRFDAMALEKQLGRSPSSAQVLSPETPSTSPVMEATVTGLTGSAYADSRILKAANADQCEVIAYPEEATFAERVRVARRTLSQLVQERIGLVNTFNPDGHRAESQITGPQNH